MWWVSLGGRPSSGTLQRTFFSVGHRVLPQDRGDAHVLARCAAAEPHTDATVANIGAMVTVLSGAYLIRLLGHAGRVLLALSA